MKKTAVILIALVIVIVAVRTAHHHPPATNPNPPAATAPATVATSVQPQADPSPARRPAPTAPTAPPTAAERAWEPVVEGFAVAYPNTHHLSRKQWLNNLQPFLSRPVINALADTDLTKVPAGHYAGYDVLKQADEALTARITYREGWDLIVYVTATRPNHWTIDSFDRSLDAD